jgi:hypothetical protein
MRSSEAGLCPASCVLANSLALRTYLAWAGGGGSAGDAVNPSMGAWSRHPCRSHPRKPTPADPSTVGKWPWASRSSHAWRGTTRLLCLCALVVATDQLSKGRRGWVCGGMSRMGRAYTPDGLGRSPTPVLPCAQDSAHAQAATELTWVKAHCLRGTASRATERTAAGGWAGPRSGTCSVPRGPTAAGPSQKLSQPTAVRTDPTAAGQSPALRQLRNCKKKGCGVTR